MGEWMGDVVGATHTIDMNPSRATIPLIRPHQCDSEGGRIRGVLLYIGLHFSCVLLTIKY